jgi:hypothetical protein
MARIRSVRPELRTSLTAAEWPREVRYFWVLLWGYLDDHGYGADEPRVIKADCFPLDDDLTADDIDKWLTLIASTIVAPGEPAPLCRYEAGGRRYLHAPKWAEHQRPQHPAIPKIPACNRSHETLMSESHETSVRASGDSHEPLSGTIPVTGVSAGQTSGGDSHETLTPEVVVVAVSSREVGAVVVAREARTRAASTLLGNSLLDEHRRHIRPSLPRDVAQAVGEKIDSLLDDPAIDPDEVREGLSRLRSNRKWGPGMLPSLVHEVRQERAGEGTPQASPAVDRREQARLEQRQRQMARAIEREQSG